MSLNLAQIAAVGLYVVPLVFKSLKHIVLIWIGSISDLHYLFSMTGCCLHNKKSPIYCKNTFTLFVLNIEHNTIISLAHPDCPLISIALL